MHTILLVDDDEYVIAGLVKHIPWHDMGVRIIGTAADGREGLDKFVELKPDFIITDIYMPAMDGFQLIEAVHALDPAVPVVILSGYDDLANARKAVSSGVHHFLLKPPSIAEIEFVVREVLQLLSESRERDELLASYLQQQELVRRSMKDAFFRELLATRYRADELPHDRIAFMGLPESPTVQALTVSLIRPEASERREEREWQLLRFGAGNIIREMVSSGLAGQTHMSAEVLEYSDEEFVVVFLAEQRTPEEQRFIMQWSNAVLDNILQYMKLSALAGLGSPCEGYGLLIDSYLQSRSAVEIAEMNEWNRVYGYAPADSAGPGKPVSTTTVRLLHEAIFQKMWAQAAALWAQLSRELADGHVPLPVCKGICSGVAGALWIAWRGSDNDADSDESIGAEAAPPPDANAPDLERLLLQLNSYGSTRPMLDWMDEALTPLITQYREEQPGKKSHALVDRVIKDHIEKCYHEELSLEKIAARLHVNRNYLSQLFKRITGEPFVTYVNKYRIRKAIELIRTGQYMVYEISERVGFQNATYFSQVFKSITGHSPSEYDR